MKKFHFLVLLVMLATPLWAAADDFERGDVDQSGTVGIDDVTCLVDYLLSNEWPIGPYDEGYWVVINTIDGPEYIPLNPSYDGRYCAAIDVIYPIFLYACQFHYRINGVDYGPDRYITEPVVGKTYRNPVKPCRNNFILKVDDNELISYCSYCFGLGIDEDNNYYAYLEKGGWAHP